MIDCEAGIKEIINRCNLFIRTLTYSDVTLDDNYAKRMSNNEMITKH